MSLQTLPFWLEIHALLMLVEIAHCLWNCAQGKCCTYIHISTDRHCCHLNHNMGLTQARPNYFGNLSRRCPILITATADLSWALLSSLLLLTISSHGDCPGLIQVCLVAYLGNTLGKLRYLAWTWSRFVLHNHTMWEVLVPPYSITLTYNIPWTCSVYYTAGLMYKE